MRKFQRGNRKEGKHLLLPTETTQYLTAYLYPRRRLQPPVTVPIARIPESVCYNKWAWWPQCLSNPSQLLSYPSNNHTHNQFRKSNTFLGYRRMNRFQEQKGEEEKLIVGPFTLRFLPPPVPKTEEKTISGLQIVSSALSVGAARWLKETAGYGRDAETKARDEGREEKVVITRRESGT